MRSLSTPQKRKNPQKEGFIISSPLTSKEEAWAHTCPKCPYVPDRDNADDYQKLVNRITGYDKYVNLRFPVRCNACEAKKKRRQNMRISIAKIFKMSAGIGAFKDTYNYPKLITFALMDEYYSIGIPSRARNKLLKKLDKKLPKVWKTLMNQGTLGGTYVLECTTKLIWSDLAVEPQMWRHHPHVHCVAVSNFVNHKKLVKYCEQLLPMGLGRINLKAARHVNKVAEYVGKYLVKDKTRKRTFGIMRKAEKWERDCRCDHEDFPAMIGDDEDWDGETYNPRYCEC